MQKMMEAIVEGRPIVDTDGKEITLLEAAKNLACNALENMEGERCRKAMAVAAAVADYALE